MNKEREVLFVHDFNNYWCYSLGFWSSLYLKMKRGFISLDTRTHEARFWVSENPRVVYDGQMLKIVSS
jgi:hypothetical protein